MEVPLDVIGTSKADIERGNSSDPGNGHGNVNRNSNGRSAKSDNPDKAGSNFQTCLLLFLRTLVPASGAFFCIGKNGIIASERSLRMVDGSVRAFTKGGRAPLAIARAFGLDLNHVNFDAAATSVVDTTRRAFMTHHFRPVGVLEDIQRIPYFRDHSIPDGFVRAIFVPLHEGGSLFGICGLERREHESAFTPADLERTEQAAPFVLAATRAQMRSDELLRETTALRALASVAGDLVVVDRDERRVVWATGSDEDAEKTDEDEKNEKNGENEKERNRSSHGGPAKIDPIAEEIIGLAELRRNGEVMVPRSRRSARAVMGVTDIEGKSIFGSSRCVVAHLQSPNLSHTDKSSASSASSARTESLSAREHEVGRLLVAGYSRVNIAAIVGLSENTVRTYMRRLYTKLGVSNRVDLVREFVGIARDGSSIP